MSGTEIEARKEFGMIRGFFWPIYKDELKKFIPLAFMMFFILFNYSLLRNMKDTLVVTFKVAGGSGAGTIAFLKAGVVLPASILFVVLYAKLTNVFSREKLFYLIVTPFVLYYALFALAIFPNIDTLHMSAGTLTSLIEEFPRLKYLIPVAGNWSYTLFYLFAELWGSIMISLLFWQFANEITRTKEAKRFYVMFGLIANFALIASWGASVANNAICEFFSSYDEWAVTLNFKMALVVFNAVVAMVIYRWINMNVLTDPQQYNPEEKAGKTKKKKPKLSVGESFKYIFSSKYLGFIALLVIGYGISINLVELVWKDQLGILFDGNKKGYEEFMGNLNLWTGTFTILCVLFLKNLVSKCGWFWGAIVTPVMILATSVGFFAFIVFGDATMAALTGLGAVAMSPVFLAAQIGKWQNVLSKSVKYTLFDSTKEMAYIPLDQDLKEKGKAAVDVIGGRLGKGSGGFINSGLLAATGGTVATITPILGGIVMVIVLAWIVAVIGLSKLYNQKLAEEDAQEEAALKVKKAANAPSGSSKASQVA